MAHSADQVAEIHGIGAVSIPGKGRSHADGLEQHGRVEYIVIDRAALVVSRLGTTLHGIRRDRPAIYLLKNRGVDHIQIGMCGTGIRINNSVWVDLRRITENKTDKADARLIGQYCRMQSPPPWRIAAPELRLLQEMVRRLHALSELAAQEKDRAQAPSQSKAVLASSKRVVAALNKELLRLKQEVRSHVKAHEDLQRDAKLLQTIPGIGEITSWDILSEMPDVTEFDSAQSVAAYAELAPCEQRSDSSVRKATTLSKRGNSRLRKAFYFPAVSAMQWNPLVKAHYERLREKGKPKMVALATCMRKLLMICYGVLKHQKPFDTTWAS